MTGMKDGCMGKAGVMDEGSKSFKYSGYPLVPAETIRKAIEGCEDAQSLIMGRYSGYVWVILRDLAHKKSLRMDLMPIDDIRQSIWLLFLSDIKNFHFLKPGSNEMEQMFDSFCKKALYHDARDVLNCYKHDIDEYSLFPMEALEEIADKNNNFDLERIEIRAANCIAYLNDENLAFALNQLREKHRTVIVLAYFLDYTDMEIAEFLKIKVSSVYQYKYEALKLLKKKLLKIH